jgi:hypothetical protein
MLRTEIHKRFIQLNDTASLGGYCGCMCAKGSSVPAGIQENKKYKRPEGIHT